MKNRRIIISDNGTIIVPTEVRMNISEIADLFDIYYQTAKRHIRVIERLGVADGDYLMSAKVEGIKIYPDYYGLDMVMAVAFRVQSKNAEVFRQYAYSVCSIDSECDAELINPFKGIEFDPFKM